MTNPHYEVIDADSENDAFPPTPMRVPARPPVGPTGGEWAIDVEDAACQWAEEHWPHHDYPDEMRAVVTDPEGVRWRVTVTVEAVPSFTGHANRIDPENTP